MYPSAFRWRRAVRLAATALLWLTTASLLSACFIWPFAREEKRQTSYVDKKLRPKGLPPRQVSIPDDVRRFKVRVYADEPYRAQTVRWEARFERLLQKFNGAVGPGFKIALELVDAQPWSASDATETDLETALESLEKLDPGTDVDWVIGLVNALPQVSATHHQLGMARLLGKHFVMRGYNDTAEREVFKKAFTRMSDDDLERLHDERREHKELLLLIHEWAHSLGAIHTYDERWIMAPVYDTNQIALSPGNTAIVRAALPHWGSDLTNDIAALYAGVKEAIESSGFDGWREEERKQLLEIVARGPDATPVAQVSNRVVAADRKAYFRAAELERQGDYAQAWRVAERLTERYESEPAVMVLGCRVAARERGSKYPTEKVCEAAARLAPRSPEPTAALARVRLEEGNEPEALALSLATQERLEANDDPSVDRKQLWRDLADRYEKLGVVTPLERALEHLPDEPRTRDLRKYVTTTRRRYGLPPGGERYGITVAAEKDYLDRVQKVLSQTYTENYKAAERTARQALETYRNAPGLLIALCDTYLRQGKYAQARKHCQRGLAEYDDSAWGHYLSAVLAQQQGDNRRAIGHYEQTIELDPSLESAYQALARAYDKVGARVKKADLAERYQKRFAVPLPQ